MKGEWVLHRINSSKQSVTKGLNNHPVNDLAMSNSEVEVQIRSLIGGPHPRWKRLVDIQSYPQLHRQGEERERTFGAPGGQVNYEKTAWFI